MSSPPPPPQRLCARLFEPRQRRLRSEIPSCVGQTTAGQLEGRINAQKVEIVGVLITTADRENAGADHVSKTVGDSCLVAAVWNAARQPFGDPPNGVPPAIAA